MTVLRVDTVQETGATNGVDIARSVPKCLAVWTMDPTTVIGDTLGMSSFVDNGTGVFKWNFSNAFAAVDYFVGYSCTRFDGADATNARVIAPYSRTTTAVFGNILNNQTNNLTEENVYNAIDAVEDLA